MSIKKYMSFIIIFIICFVCLFNTTVYADSSDLEYLDDFAVSEDNNYIYCIRDSFIIRYDVNKKR